jgi:hypothetical protein
MRLIEFGCKKSLRNGVGATRSRARQENRDPRTSLRQQINKLQETLYGTSICKRLQRFDSDYFRLLARAPFILARDHGDKP